MGFRRIRQDEHAFVSAALLIERTARVQAAEWGGTESLMADVCEGGLATLWGLFDKSRLVATAVTERRPSNRFESRGARNTTVVRLLTAIKEEPSQLSGVHENYSATAMFHLFNCVRRGRSDSVVFIVHTYASPELWSMLAYWKFVDITFVDMLDTSAADAIDDPTRRIMYRRLPNLVVKPISRTFQEGVLAGQVRAVLSHQKIGANDVVVFTDNKDLGDPTRQSVTTTNLDHHDVVYSLVKVLQDVALNQIAERIEWNWLGEKCKTMADAWQTLFGRAVSQNDLNCHYSVAIIDIRQQTFVSRGLAESSLSRSSNSHHRSRSPPLAHRTNNNMQHWPRRSRSPSTNRGYRPPPKK